MFGFSEILLEECHDLKPEHQRYLRKIVSGATRLDQLIQDVLSYSMISRSAFKLHPIDLDQLTRDIIEQYPGFQLPEADVGIEGHLPKVLANEAAMTQCVSNLVSNAIKFVKPGTTPQVRVRAERLGDETRVWFIDNGIGIAPADLDRIFGIFVKIHSPETYSGTGIGLSIVRKAAQKMNAKVGVESTLDSGSRFWLQLKTAT
jgi:signal transduction histidine kinase